MTELEIPAGVYPHEGGRRDDGVGQRTSSQWASYLKTFFWKD